MICVLFHFVRINFRFYFNTMDKSRKFFVSDDKNCDWDSLSLFTRLHWFVQKKTLSGPNYILTEVLFYNRIEKRN